jgi:hypothetical protein
MADLFALDELSSWVGSEVAPTTGALVRRMVTGAFVLEVGPMPDVIPDGLWGLGLRVAARLLDNPTSLKNESFAGYAAGFGDVELTAQERRDLRRAVPTGPARAYTIRIPVFQATETD